jgi:Fe-coproporphyrin III synthase
VSSVAELEQVHHDAVRSGFLPDRIVHLHPTRLCNLACLHCYSESDQRQVAALDPAPLCAALDVLRAEGYALLSLSGGEPLVYPHLHTVITHAKSIGFRVTMISNGLLVNDRNDAVLDLLDGMAISFDGMSETHNRLRGRADAFDRACRAVQRSAERGRPVAAAISLTRDAMPDLPDLADLLVSLGARALQIRPVARAGRARALGEDNFFTAADQARLYLIVLALQRELPDATLHCDLAPATGLWEQREAYAGLLGCGKDAPHVERPLSDLVNPLVITDTGALKPIAFDFDRRFDLPSLHEVSEMALRQYKQVQLPALQELVGGALAGMKDRPGLVDWFDHCARLSERA